MKKTLTAAALSAVMVLGLASSALAVHATDTAEEPMVVAGPSKVTVDGGVRLRGAYNKADPTPDSTADTYYETRVQLGVAAKVSDQSSAYVRLESGYFKDDNYTWGQDQYGVPWGGYNLFNGGAKSGGLNILEAWVNYNPGAWGVKAGHMPLALGNKIFFDHTGSGDDAIVFYGNLNETTHVAALTIKFDEGAKNQSHDDLDGYVALITSKISDTLSLGGNYTYLRGRDALAGTVPMSLDDFGLSNLGLTADGKIGPIDYMADVEFQFGTVSDSSDVDAGGWAAKVGANYDLGVGKVGLLFGYGSGDDDNNDDTLETYVNFLTDTSYDTIIVGYRSAVPATNQYRNGLGLEPKNTGLSDLTLFQLNGSAKTVCPLTGKDLSLFASASYMQLSEDNFIGEDEVGTELDLVATWALTAGLNYKVEAAYLFSGDAYGNDPDDLAFVRNSLDLKF